LPRAIIILQALRQKHKVRATIRPGTTRGHCAFVRVNPIALILYFGFFEIFVIKSVFCLLVAASPRRDLRGAHKKGAAVFYSHPSFN